jgi:primosomal protein N' (replication factor Y)
VPDLSLIPYFTKVFNYKISILHAGLTRTQRWSEWDKIRRGEVEIVIGSNSALFAPLRNLGLIIVDQEENETYKNYQSPRFHAVNVARELSKLVSASLILGSLTPRLETYAKAIRNGYLYTQTFKKPRVSIVNMNFERQILSLPLQRNIQETLQ